MHIVGHYNMLSHSQVQAVRQLQELSMELTQKREQRGNGAAVSGK